MNTCVVCLGEEDSNELIEYNHCGVYHVHKSCLQRWNKDECIICREEIEVISVNEDSNKCTFCLVLSILCASITSITGIICILVVLI